jgi:hypothetical protein
MDPSFSNKMDYYNNIDIQKNLLQAKIKIKIVQYKCNASAAKLNERIMNIELLSINHGMNKGLE